MSTFEYYRDLDSHPFSGEHILEKPIKVRIKDEPRIRKFFDGTKDYEQITNLTVGKEYLIHKIEGFGDVADAFLTDDNGKEIEIMIDMLEEIVWLKTLNKFRKL